MGYNDMSSTQGPGAGDESPEDHYNKLVKGRLTEMYDQCARVNALKMLFCNKVKPLTSDGTTPSNESDFLHKVVPQYVKNIEEGTLVDGDNQIHWDGFKQIAADLVKQVETWKQAGIYPEDFCAKDAKTA